jgi:hypothetical protein
MCGAVLACHPACRPCPLLRCYVTFSLASPALRGTLVECLGRILANGELVKSPQTNNLRHAVLYEAINVIIHLERYWILT